MFNYLKAILKSSMAGFVGVFAIYLFGACFSSFVEQQMNFDTTEWSKAGRSLYFLLSACMVAGALAYLADEITYIQRHGVARDENV